MENDVPQIEPEDVKGPEYISEHERRVLSEEEQAQQIVHDDTLDEPAKIDALAKVRNWFHDFNPSLDAYLAGNLSVVEAAEALARPIDETYTTGDHGRLRYSAEETARHQRTFYKDPEEAVKEWGQPEDIPEPDTENDDNASTECQLWDLWYAILHAAKRIPWTDETEQEKLVNLVRTLKARPDPPPPDNMTAAMKHDWVWSGGTVWSTLLLIGAAISESSNDCCGCGAGWTVPEQHAWINVNAFLARLTVGGVCDLSHKSMWELEEALESVPDGGSGHIKTSVEVKQSTNVSVAAVWTLLAGSYIYENNLADDGGIDGESVDLSLRGKKLPWMGGREEVKRVMSAGRWTFWRRRFAEEAKNETLTYEARELCEKAAEEIKTFQK